MGSLFLVLLATVSGFYGADWALGDLNSPEHLAIAMLSGLCCGAGTFFLSRHFGDFE